MRKCEVYVEYVFTENPFNYYRICGLSRTIDKNEDALFVNVAYDKQLIERHDNYGMTVGDVDITDRTKLCSFLKMLQKADSYKYIFLDVRFEKGNTYTVFGKVKACPGYRFNDPVELIINGEEVPMEQVEDYSFEGDSFTFYSDIRID